MDGLMDKEALKRKWGTLSQTFHFSPFVLNEFVPTSKRDNMDRDLECFKDRRKFATVKKKKLYRFNWLYLCKLIVLLALLLCVFLSTILLCPKRQVTISTNGIISFRHLC